MTPFENAFKEAGFENPKLFPVKNEYSPSLLSAPWFAVPWYSHRFKVGWQHRVIHLEIDILLSELEKESGSEYLSRLKSKLPNLEELFKEEKVTKGRRFIHAYGYEELIRYLKVILSALH